MVLVPAGIAAPVSYLSHSLGFSAMSMPSRLSLGTLLEQPKQSNEPPESPFNYSASLGIVLVGGGAIWKGLNFVLDTSLDSALPAFCQQSTSLVAAE